MRRSLALACLALLTASFPASATENDPCSDMSYSDFFMGMCMPLAMPGMPMRMLMARGQAFGTYASGAGPRGRDAFAVPDMAMLDAGSSVGDRHYLNVDLMLTAEKWLIPDAGYPELLQIGEEDPQGVPFLDAQHPHSSPVMGLTLSDTLRLGDGRDHFKLSFAPRGESTDGPIAFMHRPTGMVNPDAPLGHHVGQDVGHISSTVIAGALALGDNVVEASTFHGGEPSPESVDLPLGAPDSFAFRFSREFAPGVRAMASVAYVNAPEPSEPDIPHELRYSASTYVHRDFGDWSVDEALIFGGITRYDRASFLASLAKEFLLTRAGINQVWGRVEVLQRTPAELEIAASDPDRGRWVAALTLGYTQRIAQRDGLDLGLGGSVTKDLLPGELIGAYGGDPWSGRVFLRMGGAGMWML